jgi:hypothetical protein
VPWEELGPDFLEAWGRPNGQFQPEHMEILGPTGSGKSYFEKVVLVDRVKLRGSACVILLTKPADKTLAAMNWPVVTKWPPSEWNSKNRQVIFHAKSTGLSRAARERQAEQVEQLLDGLWHPDANVVLAVDEIAYVEQELGLRTHMTTFFREGRTLGITVVASTQRLLRAQGPGRRGADGADPGGEAPLHRGADGPGPGKKGIRAGPQPDA